MEKLDIKVDHLFSIGKERIMRQNKCCDFRLQSRERLLWKNI